VFDLWEFDDYSFDGGTIEDWHSLRFDEDEGNARIPWKVFTPNGDIQLYIVTLKEVKNGLPNSQRRARW
jgi:hypothetical protein